MWSTTITSSMRCARSQWRCSIWSIAISCSRAGLMLARSRRCWPGRARSKPAGQWSACWRSHMTAPARPNSPMRSRSISTPATCPTSIDCTSASNPTEQRSRTSRSGLHRSPPTMSSPRSVSRRPSSCSTEAWHEDRRPRRRRARRALPRRSAPARHQAGMGHARGTIRQGGLAGGPLPGGTCRASPIVAEARLPVGKTLGSFDFDAVPMVSKAQVMALTAGDSWLEKGANLLLFGPPGGGKSHLAAAIGLALVENGWRVLFTRTSDLVQRLQIARRELALESALAKLDKYHLLILDDIAYVSKDQAETSVLFELIGNRYERRSTLITSNQSFGEWGKVFPDQAMTLAAIDRLIHHATILEMNVESYRRRAALDRKRGPGRPPVHATIKENS